MEPACRTGGAESAEPSVAGSLTVPHHAATTGQNKTGPKATAAYSVPILPIGQYVANAEPMIQLVGTGPQKRLSSECPRLSPIMNQ